MYVKDYMTIHPTCIQVDTKISDALDLMAQHHFHRLPVVKEDGTLLGLVTSGLISESTGSKVTSLSIYELNYLLSKTTVKQIMIKEVHTIGEDALLEEAATKFKENHIGVLPVVDQTNKVVGILTTSDIMHALTDLLGYHQNATRFVICVDDDHPGILSELCGIFAKAEKSVSNVGVYHTQRGIEVAMIVSGECTDMKEKLEALGWKVNDVRVLKA